MIANSNLGQIAKIGDFGLSKAFDMAGLSGHTMRGDGFRGTPHFMCRKQVLEFQQAKPEVDIWAAAACLYYVLKNQYPRKFGKGEGWEVLLERDVIPIRDRNPDLPAPLAIVIDRALHEGSKTSTTLHYQLVQDFKADLAIAFNEITTNQITEQSQPTTTNTPTTASIDKNNCTDLPNRMAKAKMNSQQVDKVFYQTYPDRVNKPLTDTTLDRNLRQEWCAVANKLIEQSSTK